MFGPWRWRWDQPKANSARMPEWGEKKMAGGTGATRQHGIKPDFQTSLCWSLGNAERQASPVWRPATAASRTYGSGRFACLVFVAVDAEIKVFHPRDAEHDAKADQRAILHV